MSPLFAFVPVYLICIYLWFNQRANDTRYECTATTQSHTRIEEDEMKIIIMNYICPQKICEGTRDGFRARIHDCSRVQCSHIVKHAA